MASKLESDGSRNIQPVANYSHQLTINNLPQELRSKIFSDLGKYDLQSMAVVSSSMRASVLQAASCNEASSIKNFIDSLIQNLDIEIFSDQRRLLNDIRGNTTTQEITNLKQLKYYILDIKKSLINVIKSFDEGSLNFLIDHVQPPHFMEDIFELAKIDTDNERSFMLHDISISLSRSGNFDRAIAFARSIPEVRTINYSLKGISSVLIKLGETDRAIEVATSISDEYARSLALLDVSQVLAKSGNRIRAQEVARSIPDQHTRFYATSNI